MTLLKPQNEIKGDTDLLVAVHRISHEISSAIGLDSCLSLILDTTTELINVEIASIMLIDKIKNELSIKYARGLNDKIIKEAKSILGQKDPKEVAVWVVQHGEPLLIEDIEKDGRFLKRNGKKYCTNSLLSVPLKARGEVIGVLNVNNKKDKSIFNKRDLDIMVTLADEVSIAIQNNRLYEDLTSANERLKDLDQLKTDFVANVSHELNTPLGISKYLLSIIEKGTAGAVTDKQREYLVLIQSNIDRLTRLIDNLLNLSRLESGRFELKREPKALEDIVKEAVVTFRAQAASKFINLKTSLPKGLPDVYIDHDRIVQVFVNLIANAMKFTPDKGRIIVSAQLLKKNRLADNAVLDFVEVSVEDTGPGISAEDIDKLFVKFQRIPQKLDAAKVKGTGLGLAITKEIVEAHSGRIWIESEPGSGAKFFFTLPVYDEEFFFVEYLDKQIVKASDTKGNVCLLAFDLASIMGFKQRFTPAQFEAVVEQLYKTAKENIRRPTDLVVRQKSKNRILIAADADKAGAAVLIERIVKDLSKKKIKDKDDRQISVAIRAVPLFFPNDGSIAVDLLKKLDMPLGG